VRLRNATKKLTLTFILRELKHRGLKYTGKQAKQDNKGAWETNNQEKLQRTTKVYTRQGEHKTGIMTVTLYLLK